MSNPTPADHPLHDLIANRWSPRAFSDRPVEPAELRRVLEAARWAPSSFNEQPWAFLVATRNHRDAFDRMLACLVEGNRQWAANAPVLMIGVTAVRFARNDKPNRHAYHDLGMAIQNLALQAVACGMVTHMMAGFDPDKARQTYGIPDSHDAVTAIALGYLGDPATLPEPLREKESAPRSRKSQSEFVYHGRWGQVLR